MPVHGAQQRAQSNPCNSTAVFSTGTVHKGDDTLPADAVYAAMRLIGAVHEHGPHETAHVLDALTRRQLYALAVTLAAMAPDDYTPVELLAWNDSRYVAVEAPTTQAVLFPATIPTGRRLRPHGTHAAFVRHRTQHEEPCSACWYGEREYQRNRGRTNRAACRDADAPKTVGDRDTNGTCPARIEEAG